MRMRTLGGTGIKVSPYCLGAMMFGASGNPDHEDSIRIIHAALDGGIDFVDTADVYSAGESEEIVGKALRGRRDDLVLATKAHSPMGEDPNMRGNSRRWIVREVESSLRRLQTDYIDLYQMHRPDPDTDIDENPVRAVRPGTQRQSPRHRLVHVPGRVHRRGTVGRRPARSRPVPLRAAALLDPRPRHRGDGAAHLPAVRNGRHRLEPAGRRWLTGRYRKDADIDMTTGRARRLPHRFDPSLPGTGQAGCRRELTRSPPTPATP